METQTATRQARMDHPAFAAPGAFDALQALVEGDRRDRYLAEPARVDRPARQPDQRLQRLRRPAPSHRRKLGETDDRLFASPRGATPRTSPTPSAPRWR